MSLVFTMQGKKPVMGPRDLLNATSVAIIGASESSHYPRSIYENLIALGFPAERIYPVNPKYEKIFGVRAYPSVEAVPEPVCLAALATRRDTVLPILNQCRRKGVKAAVVLADGFAEQGSEGRQLQDRLAEAAQEAGITLLGPNTLGFVSPSTRIGVWGGGRLPGPVQMGPVALVFQSSGTLNLVLSLVCYRHVGLRAAVSVGNEAGLDVADCIEYFAEDPSTGVVGVFLETTTRPARLVRALNGARARGKPVVMLKIGRSEKARRNAIAHTGRLASSGLAWEALLRKLGVVMVRDLDELMETLVLLSHSRQRSARGGVGLFTISGGDCGLVSDLAEALGVPLPDVAPETRKVLVETTGKATLLGNPLDLENLRREDLSRFEKAVDAFIRDPGFSVVAFRMNLDPAPSPDLMDMYRDLVARISSTGRIPVAFSRAAEFLDSRWFRFFEENDAPFLQGYRSGLAAIAALMQFWRGIAGPVELPVGVPEEVGSEAPATRLLSWQETQNLLRQGGLPYAASGLARTPQDATVLAGQLGFPVAVKLVSPRLPHKSDVGAVRLGLASPEEVAEACRQMLRDVGARTGIEPVLGRDLEGFEVQAMVEGVAELLVGMTTDEAVGPVMVVGLGGIWTEVLRDTALAVPPLTETEAAELLNGLKGAPVLHGVRGRPRADFRAAVDYMVRFSRWVVEHADRLYQVDLNPVLVGPAGGGAVAVDALVVVRES